VAGDDDKLEIASRSDRPAPRCRGIPIGVLLALSAPAATPRSTLAHPLGWSLGAVRLGRYWSRGAAFHPMGAVASARRCGEYSTPPTRCSRVFRGARGATVAPARPSAPLRSSIATAATSPRWRSRRCAARLQRHRRRGSVAAAGTSHPHPPRDPRRLLAGRGAVAGEAFRRCAVPRILARRSTWSRVVQARLGRNGCPGLPPMPLRERLRAARHVEARPVFFFAVVGITRLFSPTEGAAISSFAPSSSASPRHAHPARLSDAFLETVYSTRCCFSSSSAPHLARFIVLTRLRTSLPCGAGGAALAAGDRARGDRAVRLLGTAWRK